MEIGRRLWVAVLGIALAACGDGDGSPGGGGGAGGTGGAGGSGGGGIVETCGNGIDDDGDGKADCDDEDCAAEPACAPGEICDNGQDDDGNGAVDCEDGACADDPACGEICDNGADDDGDGDVDCADADCAEACRETVCDDGLDDDGDGVADCADYDCAASCDLLACADADLGSALPVELRGSTAGAGDDVSPGCAGVGQDRAFLWTPPADGHYVIDTAGSPVDTVLAVFLEEGDCAGPELACSDRAGGDQARIAITAAAGARLRIVVDGPEAGPFVLAIREAPASEAGLCDDGVDDDGDGLTDCEDDDCATDAACEAPGCVDEEIAEGFPVELRADTWFAGNEVAPSCATVTGNDRGFLWRAPDAGSYVVQVDGFSIFPYLSVVAGEGCDGEELACGAPFENADGDGMIFWSAAVRIEAAEAGDAFVIVVDNGRTLGDGDFLLRIGEAMDTEAGRCGNGLDDDADGAPDCSDDDCAEDPACLYACVDEVLGAVDAASVSGDNFAAGWRSDASCALDGSERTLLWTAPRDGRFVFDTAGSAHDTVLAVTTPSCSAPVELACSDDAGGLASRAFVDAIAGTSYFIVVDSYADPSLDGRDDSFYLWGGPFLLTVDEAPAAETACGDRRDDDGDGLVDCDDDDCAGAAACATLASEAGHCADGRDNDGDGARDCADADCASDAACAPGTGVDRFLGAAWPLDVSDTTAGAGSEVEDGSCGSPPDSPEKILEWIVPEDGTYVFSIASDEIDPILVVQVGGPDGWQAGCTRAVAPAPSGDFTLKLRAGMRVAFRIESFQSNVGGAFRLTATRN